MFETTNQFSLENSVPDYKARVGGSVSPTLETSPHGGSWTYGTVLGC